MIKVISSKEMGKSNQGWLHSIFHFSFAEYFNPNNINFGALRVVNDDHFDPHGGFSTHPHRDMEIISYVIDGHLTHKDSMNNERTLQRGEVQYMSAGKGVTHSEYNHTDNPLRFLQIWIFPDKAGYTPNYGDMRYKWEERLNKWLVIASGNNKSPVSIHQDMDLSVVYLTKGNKITYELKKNRQAYLIQIEGSGLINGLSLEEKDAAEIREPQIIELEATSDAHYILFEMSEE